MITNIQSLKDNAKNFAKENNKPIKEENEYGGYKFKILGKAFNLKIPFSVDISTGDVITPSAIEYNYKTIFENKTIRLYTYNQETIVAEKLETVLNRNLANSRMKDFYDLYYFANIKWKELNKNILKIAIFNTFSNRNSNHQLDDFENILLSIENSQIMKNRWNIYQKKFNYAQKISFEETIKAIRNIINIVKRPII